MTRAAKQATRLMFPRERRAQERAQAAAATPHEIDRDCPCDRCDRWFREHIVDEDPIT